MDKYTGRRNTRRKFDENDRKCSKWIENTVGKGEVVRYEQFLLSHSVFNRLEPQTRKNQGLFGKVLKCLFSVLLNKYRKRKKNGITSFALNVYPLSNFNTCPILFGARWPRALSQSL